MNILSWRQAAKFARLMQSTKIGLSVSTRDLCSTDSPVFCASCGFFEAESARSVPPREREFFIDNLVVRIHFIVEMILVDRPWAMGVCLVQPNLRSEAQSARESARSGPDPNPRPAPGRMEEKRERKSEREREGIQGQASAHQGTTPLQGRVPAMRHPGGLM